MQTTSELLNSLGDQQKKTSGVYKPVFYRISDPEDLSNFENLLRTPGIIVVDHIFEQIMEFVKLKDPTRKFSTDELKLAAEKHVGERHLNTYGVWVYYPWSNRLVHVLDEEEFIEVRTSRNQYKITREERDLLAAKKIGVIGLSVGQSVSATLAMERICGELRLADFDLLELTNLNRIRTGIHNLGLAKVYSVAREIAEIDPYLKVVCYPEGLNEHNLDDFFTRGGCLDLLVEESDGFDIKILSRYKARELGVPVIMEASDKCMVDVERFDLEPDRNILHGVVKHLDVDTLKTLKTNEEKIPYMLDILGLSSTSPRLRASMLEMQQTISTWPQLGSAVTMGGGITADVSRRILLDQFTDSGRYYVDVEELIGNKPAEKKPAGAALHGRNRKAEVNWEELKRVAASLSWTDASQMPDKDLKICVEAGVAAPSFLNKQPWRWLSYDQRLFLFRESPLTYSDPGAEQTLISLGAAIENVVLKAAEKGYEAQPEVFPLRDYPDLVAVFSFKKTPLEKPALSPYIFSRHTRRGPGTGIALPKEVHDALKIEAAGMDGVALRLITGREEISEAATLLGRLEQMRLLNPFTHHDYFKGAVRWPSGKKVREGLDVRTLGLPPAAEVSFEVIADPQVAGLLNIWEKGSLFQKLNAQILGASSAIGLIRVPGGTERDLLQAGRLAEKIWLTVTKNSLAFQPICLPLTFLRLSGQQNRNEIFTDKNITELELLRTRLDQVFSGWDTREIVFLFRISDAGEARERSLRKSLNEVYFKS
jgi:molybdopterin/thiamine biosynthesis adenylyltransferase